MVIFPQPILSAQEEVTLQEFEEKEFTCTTETVVYKPGNSAKIFKWTINDDDSFEQGTIFDESYFDCTNTNRENNQLCKYRSRLRYVATSGDKRIGCQAIQTDSFGEVFESNINYVSVTVGNDIKTYEYQFEKFDSF